MDYIIKYNDNTASVSLNSFDKIKELISKKSDSEEDAQSLTLRMTNEVNEIKTKGELKEYLASQKDNFLIDRTTPLKYLCQMICNYIYEDENRETIKAEFEGKNFSKVIKQIFIDFSNFYCNATNIQLNNYLSNECYLNNQLDSDGIRNILLDKVLKGKKHLKRKFLILLYIFFLENKDVYDEIEKKSVKNHLENILLDCGFNSIDVGDEFQTLEDMFFKELIDKPLNARQKFMEQYVLTLFTCKVFYQFNDLKQRLAKNNPCVSSYKEMYKSCLGFCSQIKYSQIINGNSNEQRSNVESIRKLSDIYIVMDEVYRGTIKKLKEELKESETNRPLTDKTIDMLVSIKQKFDDLTKNCTLVNGRREWEFNGACRSKLDEILNIINKFIEDNQLDVKRKNNDLTVYIENPMCLNAKIDF